MSCKHRAAAYKYGRYIDSGCCHQKSWYILITVRHHNQCIELVSHCHSLCRICDQITGHQRIFHTGMSHSDTITYGDSREHDRCSSCHCNSHLYCLHDLVQVHMSRYDLIVRADNSDQRSVHLFFCQSQCIEQRPVRCLLHAFLYCITSHDNSSCCI